MSSELPSDPPSPSAGDIDVKSINSDVESALFARFGPVGGESSRSGKGDDGVGRTQRQLTSRHVQMIGLGGAIGTGLFVGTGYALSTAGPLGLLLAFMIVGVLLFVVLEALGELSTLYPGAGSFPHFSGRFLDPCVSFAQGWNYTYGNALGFASEMAAAAIVIQYWNTTINVAVWITIFTVIAIVIQILPVRVFGESEVITSTLKILAFLLLFIVGIAIDLGGGSNHDRLGFRYWKEPWAPFAQYNGIQGATGRFLAFLSAFLNAAYTYLGTETVVLAAGETANPTKAIPSAIRKVVYRILFFFIGGVFLVGILVPADDPRLGSTSDATASPFVIAIERAEISVLPHIVNAIILVSAWSAGNSYVYIASRTLYSLALSGRAPSIFLKVNRRGNPWTCTIVCLLFGAFAYMSVSSGASQVFSWLVALGAQGGLINWGLICLTWIRFDRALRAQGVDHKTLPYRGRGLRQGGAWFGVVISFLLALVSGFDVFLAGQWNTRTFISNYISIPIYIALGLGWKLWHRTKWVRPQEADLDSGRYKNDEAPESADLVEGRHEGKKRGLFTRLLDMCL